MRRTHRRSTSASMVEPPPPWVTSSGCLLSETSDIHATDHMLTLRSRRLPHPQAASRTPLRTTNGSTTCWAWGLCARTSTCGTARPPAPSAMPSGPSSSSARPSSSSGGTTCRRPSSACPSLLSHSSQVSRLQPLSGAWERRSIGLYGLRFGATALFGTPCSA